MAVAVAVEVEVDEDSPAAPGNWGMGAAKTTTAEKRAVINLIATIVIFFGFGTCFL